MAEGDLRHLLLGGTAATEPYTNPQKGGGGPKLPQRDRIPHGQSLLAKLEQVRQQAEVLGQQRAAYGLDADTGICVQFASEAGYDLVEKSLENKPQGIELLNLAEAEGVTTATVFVPDGKVSFFIERVEGYLNEDTNSGKPKNEKLIAGIADIRTAVFEAFWTDAPALMPQVGENAWWELWLRSGDDAQQAEAEFRDYANAEQISVAERVLRFPGRVVLHARATRDQIAQSIDLLNRIAELRRARIAVEEFLSLSALDQAEWVGDLAGRIQPAPHDAPAVCVLDTGVNRAHPLLASSLHDAVWLTYDQDWGAQDHHGHGTEVAGLALFGDLVEALGSTGPYSVEHRLESVKVLPPPNQPPNRPELFGAITGEAIARAEIAAPQSPRVVCITATTAVPDALRAAGAVTEEERDELLLGVNECRRRGKPSSWSAAIDALASGVEDAQRRLIVLSAGNTDPHFRRYYPDSNLTEGIHDPGQAWNALTIGAQTELDTVDQQKYPGWHPIAPRGDLSPSSTTSMVWQEQWPTKPDLCLEGGNQAIDPSNGEADYVDDLQLLTTHRAFDNRPLTVTGDTSAAAGLASRMAAIVSSEYSELWPETTRGLLIHSAEWTSAMTLGKEIWTLSRGEAKGILRRVGYGVPILERARWSAKNQLTLIAQETIQPFTKKGSRYVTKDMHVHELPWPKKTLEDLGDTIVVLRVTLSYFVEPNPAERGWKRRHRYASHGLRFDVRTPLESTDEFKKRLSTAVRADDDEQEDMTSGDQKQWLLGSVLRHKGSVHSDRWRGTAAELAARGVAGVYPVIGWWRESPGYERWNTTTRYSLIVSIEAPDVEVDLYTPVAQEIGIAVAV